MIFDLVGGVMNVVVEMDEKVVVEMNDKHVQIDVVESSLIQISQLYEIV
jgi:hypothetical protein